MNFKKKQFLFLERPLLGLESNREEFGFYRSIYVVTVSPLKSRPVSSSQDEYMVLFFLEDLRYDSF